MRLCQVGCRSDLTNIISNIPGGVGTVPVYLGDSAHLKYLLPEPSAAIYISDYQNISALVEYLTYLSTNETAYEQHRSWRSRFTYEGNVKNKPILKTSWFCRVCQWAGFSC